MEEVEELVLVLLGLSEFPLTLCSAAFRYGVMTLL